MKPLPWSHSSLEKFRNCPHAYHEIKVLQNFTDAQHESSIWGNWAHEQIEFHYGYKTQQPWHENMLPYVPHIEAALAWAGGVGYSPGTADVPCKLTMLEKRLALNTKIKPCEWEDPDVWGRGIVDALIINGPVAYVIDWKTGKVKPDSEQLKLFALLVFYHYPWVTECHTSFEWLQHGKNTRERYFLLNVHDMWRSYMPKLTEYKTAFKTDTWQKRPSGLCNGWCAVENCIHWKPKR